MLERFHTELRRNLVAYLALLFALGGTAIAAKPLITGADVKDGSLTGPMFPTNRRSRAWTSMRRISARFLLQ